MEFLTEAEAEKIPAEAAEEKAREIPSDKETLEGGRSSSELIKYKFINYLPF